MNNIMMNEEMTKAILDGRKTQTRRAIKQVLKKPIDSKYPKNEMYLDSYNNSNRWYWWTQDGRQNLSICIKAKYKKDEVIWVREPAKVIHDFLDSKNNAKRTMKYKFLADGKDFNIEIPSRFIAVTVSCGNFIVDYPRWIHERQRIPNGCIKEMARIFLKITDVRVERLQDIGANGIEDEGYHISIAKKIGNCHEGMNDWWVNLWNKTAPKGYKWEDNPYVFVYEFERVNQDGSKLK